MRKSKVLKALLVFGMSIATATSVVGMTACNGGHEHTYGDWQKDKDGHWKVATCHTDVTTEKEAHKDENKDNKCDVCGYTLQEASNPGDGEGNKPGEGEGEGEGEKPGEGEGEQNPPVADNTELVAVDMSTITFSTTDELKTGSGVYAGSAVVESDKSATIIYKGNEINVTKTVQVASLTKSDQSKALRIEVSKSASVIIYALSGSNGSERQITMTTKGADDKFIDVTGQSIGEGNGFVGVAVFDLESAGTYYFGSNSGNVHIYYVAIVENLKENKTFKEVNGTPATCGVAGTIKHTISDFGRHYKEDGSLVVNQAGLAINPLEHDYSLVPDSITIPTETAPGSVQLKCAHEENPITVALPALNSPEYGTPVAGDNNKSTYTIVKNGVTITFEADTVSQVSYKFEAKYSNLFSTPIDGVGFGSGNANQLAEGLNIYGTCNDSSVTEWNDNYKVSIADNKLTVKDTSNKTAYANIEFTEAKTSGKYKISGTLNLNMQKGSWSVIQLIGSDTKAFAALRSNSSKLFGLYGTTGDPYISTTDTNYKAYTANSDFDFEIVIDLDNKKLTLKIGSIEVVDEEHAFDISTLLGENGWSGFKVQTADTDSRTVILSNLTIYEWVIDESATA